MEPITNVVVDLVGQDGNAFSIIARVRKALKKGGHADLVEPFTEDATSGDYDHVLQTVMKYCYIKGWSDEEEQDYEDDMEDYGDIDLEEDQDN